MQRNCESELLKTKMAKVGNYCGQFREFVV